MRLLPLFSSPQSMLNSVWMLLPLLLMLSHGAHAGQLREWNHVECHADEHACILLPDDFKEMKESPDFDFWRDVVRASGPECHPNNEYMIITEDGWAKEYAQRYQFCKKQDPDALTKEHCPAGEVYCHDGQSVTCMPRKYYRTDPTRYEHDFPLCLDDVSGTCHPNNQVYCRIDNIPTCQNRSEYLPTDAGNAYICSKTCPDGSFVKCALTSTSFPTCEASFFYSVMGVWPESGQPRCGPAMSYGCEVDGVWCSNDQPDEPGNLDPQRKFQCLPAATTAASEDNGGCRPAETATLTTAKYAGAEPHVTKTNVESFVAGQKIWISCRLPSTATATNAANEIRKPVFFRDGVRTDYLHADGTPIVTDRLVFNPSQEQDQLHIAALRVRDSTTFTCRWETTVQREDIDGVSHKVLKSWSAISNSITVEVYEPTEYCQRVSTTYNLCELDAQGAAKCADHPVHHGHHPLDADAWHRFYPDLEIGLPTIIIEQKFCRYCVTGTVPCHKFIEEPWLEEKLKLNAETAGAGLSPSDGEADNTTARPAGCHPAWEFMQLLTTDLDQLQERVCRRRCPSLGELTCHRVQGLPKAAPDCRPADQYAYATGKDPLITDTDVLCVPLGGNASSAVFSSGPVLPILIFLYTLNQMA